LGKSHKEKPGNRAATGCGPVLNILSSSMPLLLIGLSWFIIFRASDPFKPWLDKTLRPSDLELVK
jgi:hypothetical protein